MKCRQVNAIPFMLALFLMAGTLPALSQSPDSPNSSKGIPFLQLGSSLLFLNSDHLSLHIPSGAYAITAKSPDTLQLTSASTGEAQTLHATPMTHTEPVTAPYPFLIEDAKEQGHVHLILLLPNGQGLDAEGRLGHTQSRGFRDTKKFTFTPTRQYTGVVMQQGRVTTDTDFNEQESVASSAVSGPYSSVVPSSGRVTLEQGRIQLDEEARQVLLRRCRFCAGKQ
ncbi:MAG: hypothetical protein WBO24_01820 [Nitrospirales bacterium]